LEAITARPTRDSFRFLAGTSTGAIIAAGLATGVPARQIAVRYEADAPRIFDGAWWRVFARLLNWAPYDVALLHRLIAEGLPEWARETTLNELDGDILLTAKQLDDGHPWYFVRDRPGENSARTGSLRLVDCVTASCAAPTYLAPWRIEGIGELVDGGIGVAGNPVYQAAVEAFEYTRAYEPETTIIVSLGTGRFTRRTRPGWLGEWLGWVLGELLRSPEEQQTEIAARHYPARLYRIDVDLPRDIAFDEVRAIGELRRIGERLADEVDWEMILAGSDSAFLVQRPGD
jgi:predicted acylesterase/phospholipase RssA